MNPKLGLIVIKQELLNFRSLILLLLLSSLFILMSLFIINLQTIISIFQNSYPFLSKLYISLIIIFGSFSATSTLDIALVIIMGILFGINMTLVINKFSMLKRRGNLRIMFGTGVISVLA